MFIHSSVNGHLNCICVLAVMNNTAMSIQVVGGMSDFICLECIAEYTFTLKLDFCGATKLISKAHVPFYFLTNKGWWFKSPSILVSASYGSLIFSFCAF